MANAILVFIAVFLLILAAGTVLSHRYRMVDRVSQAINPVAKPRTFLEIVRGTGLSVGAIFEQFKHVLPKSETEISVARERLNRAGYRTDSALNIFNGSKILVPLLLCVLAAGTGLGSLNPFFVYVAALGMGFIVPDFWLGKRIKARQGRIARGLPDVLDLLVICTEAGLSLDQATARTAEELKRAQPDLCDELGIVVLEQRAGLPRSVAWRKMADRSDVEALKNLVSMLVQAEQFGTGVAKTMRTHAETLRTQRVQAIEEKAAKTSVKLLFPLAFFIFPSLFIVVLGPAAIVMIESFAKI